MKLQNKKGFTLIELLVVITIIGILATGATATYTSQIQKARDTTRVNDIKALQAGIEQVYQDKGEYPPETAGNAAGSFAENVKTYVQKFPKDPKSEQSCNNGGIAGKGTPCDYYYDVNKDGNDVVGQVYRLSTGFENKGNVDTKAKNDGGVNDARLEIGVGIGNATGEVGADDAGFVATGIKSATSNASCSTEFSKIVIKGNC